MIRSLIWILNTFQQKLYLFKRSGFKAGQPAVVKGTIEFQSCNDETCILNDADFSFNVGSKGEAAVSQPVIKSEIPLDVAVGKHSLWWFLAFSFLAGLAAILTPCVFPMIPMTVSFFMNSNKSPAQAKIQAFAYGISIILIYTLIGTIVALTLGADFANWLSTYWLPNVLFFIIFVVFAFSFFGAFEIILPSSWVNRSDKKADEGGIGGAFFMALTLVLVSFSCTGPIVGAILVESAGGMVIKPIVGMLGFSLAFCTPIYLICHFSSMVN